MTEHEHHEGECPTCGKVCSCIVRREGYERGRADERAAVQALVKAARGFLEARDGLLLWRVLGEPQDDPEKARLALGRCAASEENLREALKPFEVTK